VHLQAKFAGLSVYICDHPRNIPSRRGDQQDIVCEAQICQRIALIVDDNSIIWAGPSQIQFAPPALQSSEYDLHDRKKKQRAYRVTLFHPTL